MAENTSNTTDTGSVQENSSELKGEWRILLEEIKEADINLYQLISQKMLNFMCWRGVLEAERLLESISKDRKNKNEDIVEYENRPMEREDLLSFNEKIFKIAYEYIPDEEILFRIQKWIQEDKLSFLVKIIEDPETSLEGIAEAIKTYTAIAQEDNILSPYVVKGLNVNLIRRFLSEDLQFISVAKDHVDLNDFYFLLQRMIYSPKSMGRIGGKSVGIFIANKILKSSVEHKELFADIKTPKTWYIASDEVLNFINHNNLEEVYEQKYKDIELIRQEYPYIVQVFKNSSFPAHILKQLSEALDDFGSVPLVVRSSSLLEDRIGSAFSGKYKSLFVANQGTKQERLRELTDAIAEVYASVFSSDPIEYRSERGLLDYNEEMGVMIQEVVGCKVGKYYLPSYAGVLFSSNEFRWSPRIKREDGLLRMVLGLGTRAVDRVSDDFPVLIAPSQPGLRVNVTVDEIYRYSPKMADVINLETNSFETVAINDILKEYGSEYPQFKDVFSVIEQDQIKKIIHPDFDDGVDDFVATFDRLITSTNFVKKVQALSSVLKENLKTPVDIEFASTGENFYLLQCRPQSFSNDTMPAQIPADIKSNKIIFTAKKFISNGRVPDITHIVYVSPEGYNSLPSLNDLKSVGRAVGKLNKMLPRRRFILMGPGRWGSRGDIKLGVSVTYSDINNTAALIEIARKKGNYVPDLSFGTHFFQDLVESAIRYIPLYPDDKGIEFNEKFLTESTNVFNDLLPEYEHLSNTIKVIDVQKVSGGEILKVLMNAELNEAVAYLAEPAVTEESETPVEVQPDLKIDDHWRWRYRMAEKIASELDGEKFGVKAFYLFGSTKNAIAGPKSDINILLQTNGNEHQKQDLLNWLEGWSLCLGEMNFLRTGYRVNKILDVKIVSEEDTDNKDLYAAKIGAATNAAKALPLKGHA
jgi:pyruvate,water dikinase